MSLINIFKQAAEQLLEEATLSTNLSQADIADDIAEKAAFERGDTGNATETEVNNVAMAMLVLPLGSVLVGCSGQLYTKVDVQVWDEVDQEEVLS